MDQPVEELLREIPLGQFERNLLVSAAVIAVVLLLRWVILRLLHRNASDAQVWFSSRKYATYVAFFIIFLALTEIWLGGLGGALTSIGIISAGIAIALTDVLKNMAGWAYIILRRPFRVGDRIELGDHQGDVVDVRVFRFSMLEIGNWVDADQSTGRLVHVPNGLLFTEPVINATEGFPLIWDEVDVLVTFESDWERAEQMVLEAVQSEAPDVHERRYAESIRSAARGYFIRYTHLEPTVYLSVRDSGVMLTGRFLVGVRERRGVTDAVWRSLLRAMAADPSVELAYPTQRVVIPNVFGDRKIDEGRGS